MKKYIKSTEQIWPLILEYNKNRDVKIANQIIDDVSFCIFSKIKNYKNCEYYEDLVQEGKLGIFYALKKFNPERSNNFFQFVNWYIKNQIRNYLLKQEKYKEIPTETSEIVKLLNQSEDFEEKILKIEEKIILLSALNNLPPKERKILEQRSGLNSDIQTYKEISEKSSFSKQRAFQIYKNSLNKIKNNKILKDYFKGEDNVIF
jgi:RNA polymerase sigma factor (sigma-70 family)